MPAVMKAILKARIPEMAFIARAFDPNLAQISDFHRFRRLSWFRYVDVIES